MDDNKEMESLYLSIINTETAIEVKKKQVYPYLLLQSFTSDVRGFADLNKGDISTSLFSFNKYLGSEAVIDVLFTQITKAVLFFGASKSNISDDVIRESCVMINEAYSDLTIEDIKLVLRKAKNGDFGAVFGHIGGSVILSWFKQYKDEKVAYFEQKNESSHLATKTNDERQSDKDALNEKLMRARLNFENKIK